MMKRLASGLAIAFALSLLSGCAMDSSPQSFDELPPPTKPQITDDRAEELIQEGLDSAWKMAVSEHPDLDRPDVAVVRVISESEWAPAMAECMAAAGFAGTASEDGGFESEFGEGLGASHALSLYTCNASYPIDPRYREELTESQVKYLYAYYRDVLVPCLEDAGEHVPDIPSEQAFVDSYATDAWSPYINVNPATEKQWLDLTSTCPQAPANLR